ncbi:MAG TPA: hypothetical protein VGC79_18395, partial [Polyangiaceae bacterium]
MSTDLPRLVSGPDPSQRVQSQGTDVESFDWAVESFRGGHWTSLLFAVTVLSACARGAQPPTTDKPQPPDVPKPAPAPPAAGADTQPPAELKVAQLADEPILTIGHGAFFDRNGTQIPLTLAFVDYAQRYYHDQMAAALRGSDKQAFATLEQIANGSEAKGQDRLLLRSETLEWLLAVLPASPYKQQVEPKVRGLNHALNWVVPERADL